MHKWFIFSLREILLITALVALAFAWWRVDRQNADLRQETQVLRAATKIPPLTDSDRQKAIQAAEALLAQEVKAGRLTSWGPPLEVEEGMFNTAHVIYATPKKEYELLGSRAVSVHRDDWSAFIPDRD
jgi:hypothetical protein